MLAVVKRYSEEIYASKEDIMKEFDISSAHIIWDEIQAYRRHFLYHSPILKQPMYIVCCRSVVFSMMRCEEALRTYSIVKEKDHRHVPQACEMYPYLSQRFELYGQWSIQDWVQEACSFAQVDDVTTMFYLVGNNDPFLLRLFQCLFLLSEQKETCLRLLLIKEQRTFLHELFDIRRFECLREEYKTNDRTHQFLAFLKQLELKISQGMVLLKCNLDDLDKSQSEDVLCERYPQLSIVQIRFYIEHRVLHHYYTIQQYMKYGGVCYETARCAMDMFVSLHWYQKRKLGKKFVYYIN